MKNIILIVVSFTLLISQQVFAGSCSTSENKLTIYFSNGMNNTEEDAEDSKNALQIKTESTLSNYSSVRYEYSYNEWEHPILQGLEVFRQKKADAYSLFWRYFSNVESAPDWFREIMQDLAQIYNFSAYMDDTDLQNHITKYKQEISNCNRLLIVAHSQGNFYANAAWDNIYSGKDKSNKWTMNNFPNLGLLSVASPSNHVGDWLLNVDDHQPITALINNTNDIVPLIGQGGNVTNTNEDLDNAHHNFINSYLNGNNSGPLIIQAVTNISEKLEVLPFERIDVVSSSLKSVGYLAKSNLLEVEFVSKDSIYRYYNIPQQTYDALMSASSHGSYFYANIRSSFTYKKIYAGT